MNVADLADEIFRELDQPADLSTASISFWLTSNIGQLNLLLNIDILIVSSDFSPELTEEQAEIYKIMFEVDYTERQVRKNLYSAGYDSSVLQVQEGNRMVRVVNKTDIAKTLMGLKASLAARLQQLILAYKVNDATPAQIALDNPIWQIDGFAIPVTPPI